MSAKLMDRFADCLAEQMTAGEAAAAPPPGPAGESAEAAARAPSEALDLGEASREAVLKRVVPAAAAIAALIVLLGILGRRR